VSTATSAPVPDVAPASAEQIHALAEGLDAEATGAAMHAVVRELYPLGRSITGEGLRQSLRVVDRISPLTFHEVPSGTPVLDWVIPPEWNLRAARLVGPDGAVVVDASALNLHVLGYSIPFRGKVSREELEPHLHSLPEQPDLVPYRTSYYAPDWGFCLSHRQRQALPPGEYDVLIDATLADGSLTYGEMVVPGASAEEVLVSTHCCHPSLANDNVSGMVLAATLARLLRGLKPRYTYRFLFVPGTVGAIAWLARNEERTRRVAHGLVLACAGDSGRLTYKQSRRGDADIDRAVAHVLRHSGADYEIRPFTPYGYDERQYCSPGFDLPVGALTRTPHGEFPEYHTSGDDPGLVKPDRLADTLKRCLQVFEVLEGDGTYVNLAPKGEPQLGRRGLYGSVGGQSHAVASQMALLWVLSLCDGSRSLLGVAERAQIPFTEVRRAARALEAAGLLAAED
jgi:aminopeptidase-like protein